MIVKSVNQENYRDDPLYRRVVNAVRHLQETKGDVTPINVLMTLGMLPPTRLQEWRQGRIPFLEAVLQSNLSKTNRILRILHLHARDLHLTCTQIQYTRQGSGAGAGRLLIFSKSNDPNIERAYARLYTPPAAQ